MLTGATAAHAQSKFSFVFMSDIHYTQKFNAPKGFQMLVDTLNQLNPDLVMVGGDIIYDALRVTEKELMGNTNAYLKAASQIKAPLHYAVGNHEVFELYQKNADTSGALFGNVTTKNISVNVIILSTIKAGILWCWTISISRPDRKYIGKIDSVQLGWIKEDLKTVSERNADCDDDACSVDLNIIAVVWRRH